MLVIKHAMYVNKKKLIRELKQEFYSFNGNKVWRSGRDARPAMTEDEKKIADDYFHRGFTRALNAVARAAQMSKLDLEKEIAKDAP